MLMVNPIIPRMIKEMNIESGIAMPTNNALRTPKKNNKTKTTKITPEIILFSKLSTIFRVRAD